MTADEMKEMITACVTVDQVNEVAKKIAGDVAALAETEPTIAIHVRNLAGYQRLAINNGWSLRPPEKG